MNECERSIGWLNYADGRKPNYFEKNLSQCCVNLFPTNPIRKSQIEPQGDRTATKCVSKARPHTCLVLKTVSNDTELSPSQVAQSHLESTEFPQLLFKMNVHYRIHNSSPLGPILRQPNLAYIFLLKARNSSYKRSFNSTEFLTIWKIHSKYFVVST